MGTILESNSKTIDSEKSELVLSHELFADVLRRGVIASSGNLFLFIVVYLSAQSVFKNEPILFVSGIVLLLMNMIRIVAASYLSGFFVNDQNFSRVKILYGLFVMVSATLWSMIAMRIISIQGFDSRDSLVAFVMMIGVASSGALSLAAVAWLTRLLLACLLIVPALYLILMGNGGTSLGVICLAYAVFLHEYTKSYRSDFIKLQVSRRRLHDEQQLSQKIVEAIPGPVSLFDSKLRYKAANSKLVKMEKRDLSEFIGHPLGFARGSSQISDFIRDFADDPSLSEVSKKIAVEQPTGPRWFMVTLARDAVGDIICISVDVHREVELELQEIESRARVVESAKLAALGEMAAGIAHEINNPLAVISTRATRVEERLTGCIAGATATESELLALVIDVNKIQETCSRIARIVKGLRVVSRNGDRDPFRTTRVREIVEDVLGLCHERFRSRGVTLATEDVPDVEFDCRATQVAQVLLNLLNNAFDAVYETRDPWVKLVCEVRGGSVVFVITDSGTGIPKSISSKIMEPFFTTKGVGRGTGLGLSISRQILRDHQGSLELRDDRPNTTFEASFPMSQIEIGGLDQP
jgi:signal transduction histidine kinase